MKPIEPGCLCMVVNMPSDSSHHNGKSLTMIRYHGEVSEYAEKNFWEHSPPLMAKIYQFGEYSHTESCVYIQEEYLLRIDGEDFSHERQEEKELVK